MSIERAKEPGLRPGEWVHGFLLEFPTDPLCSSATLRLAVSRVLKNGRPGAFIFAGKYLALLPPRIARRASWLDRTLSRDNSDWLVASSWDDENRRTWRLTRRGAEDALPELAEDRLLWLREDVDSKAASRCRWLGEPLSLVLELEPSGHEVRVQAALTEGGRPVDLASVARVTPTGIAVVGDGVGLIATREQARWLRRLLEEGELRLPANRLAAFLNEDLAAPGSPVAHLPEGLMPRETAIQPRPLLHIAQLGTWQLIPASVHFDYDGVEVDARPGKDDLLDPERGRRIRRDPRAEAGYLEQAREVWPELNPRALQSRLPAERLSAVVRLHQSGWEIRIGDVPLRAAGRRRFRVRARGRDWFDLEGWQEYGETRLAIPALLAALERGETVARLEDGSLGLLPEGWLRHRRFVLSAAQRKKSTLRYGRSQAALLDALLDEDEDVDAGPAFTKLRRQVREAASLGPKAPPESFCGTLRPYQQEGLGWLAYLRKIGFGGCLADDMGLGKTVQVLALLDGLRKQERPSLLVVPRSLLSHWLEEAGRFTPKLRLRPYHGPDRNSRLAELKPGEVLLTTYGTLRRDGAILPGVPFDTVVLDEAQAIKNRETATARSTRALDARHRLALSGTPVENHLGELESLFAFLNQGLFGRSSIFRKLEAGGEELDEAERAGLARALRPFLLRRTKSQVAPELPERIESTLRCEMEEGQQRLYDELKDHYRQRLRARVDSHGLAKSSMHVLEALLRLRQAACHPGLLDKRRAQEACAKFERLLPMLEELAQEGHKALVFSQFTSFLSLLKPRLKERGLCFEYLDGRTRKRAEKVARFQQDAACPVFLISLKAGGLGLNLTAASYVFLLDPWWNPAVEAQAIDRTHRIGQSRTVTAYRLLVPGTVEEKIAKLQQEKRELADAILGADHSLLHGLDLDELEQLLS